MLNKGQVVAFSAPSGTGKSTITTSLLKKHKDVSLSISATTRLPRGKEKNGEHYFFLSKDAFRNKIGNGDLLEWEEVHGNYYGTLKSEIVNQVSLGKTVLLDIDVKGALSVKEVYPEAKLLFLKPPSLEELRKRLEKRGTETTEEIDKRLERVNLEYEKSSAFDFIVVNDELNKTIKQIEAILTLD